jgi:hypothetical protein
LQSRKDRSFKELEITVINGSLPESERPLSLQAAAGHRLSRCRQDDKYVTLTRTNPAT